MLVLFPMNISFESYMIQWNSTLYFYHIHYVLLILVYVGHHDNGWPSKLIAYIKKLYPFVCCKCSCFFLRRSAMSLHGMNVCYMIYDIYIYIYLAAVGLTPCGVVQYTFTHKQYTDYRERNTHNNKQNKHT
jgi:hypothetical protein